MRYRPFGNSGMAVSTLSLLLREREAGRGRRVDWRALVFGALEAGINKFEVSGATPGLLDALAAAGEALDRRFLFVAWRLDGAHRSAEDVVGFLRGVLARTNLGYFDLLMLHEPAQTLSSDAIARLRELQDLQLTRMLGVSGDDEAIDGYIATGAFQALSTTYHIASGWKPRHRIQQAGDANMAIIGRDCWPKALSDLKPAPPPRRSWFGPRVEPLQGMGGYNFLHQTPGWTAEEICLAFALTEPAIATVQIEADNVARIQRLAAITERDLPAGAGAQIEMASFSPRASGAA